jgi:hypothetical protein
MDAQVRSLVSRRDTLIFYGLHNTQYILERMGKKIIANTSSL